MMETQFISSSFALWANAELYILATSLTDLLTPAENWKNLNFDARTLKFDMKHH